MTDNTTQAEVTLLPCPFCGGPAKREDYGRGRGAISCQNCFIRTRLGCNGEDMSGDWNTRLSQPPIASTSDAREAVLNDIAVMMSEFVDNWPEPKKIDTALALIAKTMRAALDPPKHKFWMPGEPDCPREIKARNGELHTLRCKVCGQDSPRDPFCRKALSAQPAPVMVEALKAIRDFECNDGDEAGAFYAVKLRAKIALRASNEVAPAEPSVVPESADKTPRRNASPFAPADGGRA